MKRHGVTEYEPTPEEVEEVRKMVDKLVEEGKVYRDKDGKIWPLLTGSVKPS